MWLTYAFGSAFLAGITAILAKVGMGKTDSSLATAIRTIVVVIFSWLMVFLVGSQNTITQIGAKSLLFWVLSGLATGASWLCYFRALQLGDVNKVTPIDKSSTVLTMILAVIILHGGSFSVKQRSCFLQFHKFYHEREHALLTGHEIGDHCLEDHKFPALQLPVERSESRFVFHKAVLDHPFLFYSMRQMECLCPKPEDGI